MRTRSIRPRARGGERLLIFFRRGLRRGWEPSKADGVDRRVIVRGAEAVIDRKWGDARIIARGGGVVRELGELREEEAVAPADPALRVARCRRRRG